MEDQLTRELLKIVIVAAVVVVLLFVTRARERRCRWSDRSRVSPTRDPKGRLAADAERYRLHRGEPSRSPERGTPNWKTQPL
jgi:hypothetical protein